MNKKDPRAEGFPWAAPYMTVRDPQQSIDFYEKAFGFGFRSKMLGTENEILHAEMTYKDMIFMFGPEGAFGKKVKAPVTTQVDSPINMYVYCENIDSFFENAKLNGAEIVSKLEDMFWGDRTACFKDPDGYIWTFATHTGQKPKSS